MSCSRAAQDACSQTSGLHLTFDHEVVITHLLLQVLSQRLFSRIATLVTAAAAHNKQTVIAACIIAELAMGYYRALLKQRRNTAARAFLVEALGTEAVHDCFGMLVRARYATLPDAHKLITYCLHTHNS